MVNIIWSVELLESTFLQALQDTNQYRLKTGRLELQFQEEADDETPVVVLLVLDRRD